MLLLRQDLANSSLCPPVVTSRGLAAMNVVPGNKWVRGYGGWGSASVKPGAVGNQVSRSDGTPSV